MDTVIKAKLMESKVLLEQAANITKEQFATSPDLDSELLSAAMAALDAHTTMSTQALSSDKLRAGLKDIAELRGGSGRRCVRSRPDQFSKS